MKRANLELYGTLKDGCKVKLTIILADGRRIERWGELPANKELADLLDDWREGYGSLKHPFRIRPARVRYNLSLEEIGSRAIALVEGLRRWLDCDKFRPLDKKLRQAFNWDDEICYTIRTDCSQLRQLPWHRWDLIETYPFAALAFSSLDVPEPPPPPFPINDRVRILAILGNSNGIDVEKDRQLLRDLPNADVTFLVEPKSTDIHDSLWEQRWDIIFFAGHGETIDGEGVLYINPNDAIKLEQLWYGLRKATDNGLKLAIFNSCNGLGLVRQLDDWQLPLAIVMREAVPDFVAQEFLTNFLKAFAEQKLPFYQAAREARERLQGWENDIPCASWLPVIYQHPDIDPPAWEQLYCHSVDLGGDRDLDPPEDEERVPQPSKRKWVRRAAIAASVLVAASIGWLAAAPQVAKTINNWGFENYRNGELRSARRLWEAALWVNPLNRATHYNLAWLCEEVKDFECARLRYQEAAQLGLSAAYSNLARLYILQDEDYDSAADLSQQGIELEKDGSKPVRYALFKNLGWARLEQNRLGEAKQHLGDAIALDEKRAAAHCLLAQVYENEGDRDRAIDKWKTCLELASPEAPDEDVWISMARSRLDP